MKIKEVIEKLAEADPEDDLFFIDAEYGPTAIEHVGKELHEVTSQHGLALPKMVWVLS